MRLLLLAVALTACVPTTTSTVKDDEETLPTIGLPPDLHLVCIHMPSVPFTEEGAAKLAAAEPVLLSATEAFKARLDTLPQFAACATAVKANLDALGSALHESSLAVAARVGRTPEARQNDALDAVVGKYNSTSRALHACGEAFPAAMGAAVWLPMDDAMLTTTSSLDAVCEVTGGHGGSD